MYTHDEVVAIVNLRSPAWTDLSMPFDLDELRKHPGFANAMRYPAFERAARARAGGEDADGRYYDPERMHPLAIMLSGGLAPAKEPISTLTWVNLGFLAYFAVGAAWCLYQGMPIIG